MVTLIAITPNIDRDILLNQLNNDIILINAIENFIETHLDKNDVLEKFENILITNYMILIAEYDENHERVLDAITLLDQLEETFNDVQLQLFDDEKRYGNEWAKRGLIYNGQSQEERFFIKMDDYYRDYREGIAVNWNKVIGEAHICKLREKIFK